MIKIAIVDDEVLARKVLEDYCTKITNFKLVISTGNPLEFYNFLQENEIHLVFLDIEMPELNGMEILRSMINAPKVILTTAYSEFALESYNYGVVDYLLKPIKLERFLKAINKVSSSTLMVKKSTQTKEELQIKHNGILLNIALPTIQYIQSFGNYLKVFTDERMYLITETLTKIKIVLPENFQQTHKSYIANLQRVTKYTKDKILINDKIIPISNSYKIIIQKNIQLYLNSI